MQFWVEIWNLLLYSVFLCVCVHVTAVAGAIMFLASLFTNVSTVSQEHLQGISYNTSGPPVVKYELIQFPWWKVKGQACWPYIPPIVVDIAGKPWGNFVKFSKTIYLKTRINLDCISQRSRSLLHHALYVQFLLLVASDEHIQSLLHLRVKPWTKKKLK